MEYALWLSSLCFLSKGRFLSGLFRLEFFNGLLGVGVEYALSPLLKRALRQTLLAFLVKYHTSIFPQSKRVFLDVTRKIAI